MRVWLIALLLFATAAQATPPRMARSTDTLIAANDTHFFVLRDIADSRGSYYNEFRDQYLVEIAFGTHQATRHWLLRSLTLTYEDETPLAQGWQEADMAAPNMHEILKTAGAVPAVQLGGVHKVYEFVVEAGDLIHTAGDSPVKALSGADILVFAKASLNPVVAGYGPDPEQGWMGSQFEVNTIDSFEPADCELIAETATLRLTSGPHVGVKLDCYLDADAYGQAEVFLFVPVRL